MRRSNIHRKDAIGALYERKGFFCCGLKMGKDAFARFCYG